MEGGCDLMEIEVSVGEQSLAAVFLGDKATTDSLGTRWFSVLTSVPEPGEGGAMPMGLRPWDRHVTCRCHNVICSSQLSIFL